MIKSERDSPGGPTVVAVESFDAFYLDNYRSVLAVVVGLMRRFEDAEDVTQDAFLKAQRMWDEVATYDYRLAWVKRVALNLATSRLRRFGAETRAIARVAKPAPVDAAAEPADEVWAAVRKLPRLQAQCIALRYVDDLSVAQISEVLTVAEGTVKSSLARARITLAATLEAP